MNVLTLPGVVRIYCKTNKKAIFLENQWPIVYTLDDFSSRLHDHDCDSKEFVKDYIKYEWGDFEVTPVYSGSEFRNNEVRKQVLEKVKQNWLNDGGFLYEDFNPRYTIEGHIFRN